MQIRAFKSSVVESLGAKESRLVAGFLPHTDTGTNPLSNWVKMGRYNTVHTAYPLSNTEAWRDYNNDGVRDPDGDPFAIENGPAGDNEEDGNRSPKYADYTISLENQN